MKKSLHFLVLCLFLAPATGFSASEDARLLVHILDYVSKDYPVAVQNGRILNKDEFKEQENFLSTALDIHRRLPAPVSSPEIGKDLETLQGHIKALAPEMRVSQVAQKIKWEVVRRSGIAISPRQWPNLAHGKKLYDGNCASCHGSSGAGDGPSGKTLEPSPSNFQDPETVASMTPFQSFNAIRLGVDGTAMASFGHLSDAEIWDLAFYVNSFRFPTPPQGSELLSPVSLTEAASRTDKDLAAKFTGPPEEVKRSLGAVRHRSEVAPPLFASLAVAKQAIDHMLSAYRAQNFDEAARAAMVAYLEGIEPIEPRLRSKNVALLNEIEQGMAALRSDIKSRVSVDALVARVTGVQGTLASIEKTLSTPESSPWVTFWLAAGIFLREAFEAVLLIVTLLGVIKSLGSRPAHVALHLGWTSAVAVGIVCWIFSGWVLRMSGLGRELLEGIVSATAVVILLYFGFWLHRKTEIGRWHNFLKDMARSASQTSSLVGFFGISFMAVFREAFETVLFLRALSLEGAETGADAYILAGVLASLLVVIAIAFALMQLGARLPIRQLFNVSSLVLAFLAFTLVGKAVHSFQETGIISATPLDNFPRVDLLGMFPTYETVLPQLIVLAVTLGVWLWGKPVPKMSRASTHD